MIDFMTRNWWIPPRAADFVNAGSGRPPPVTRWFQTWVNVLFDKRTGQIVEERAIIIKLPVFGMYYSINCDEERWGQLVFRYYGQRGCCFGAVFDEVGQ